MAAGRERNRYVQEQLHFFQTLIDKVPSPIFYKDIWGCYLGCNKAFEEYLGVKRNELMGLSEIDIVKDPQKNPLHCAISLDISGHPGSGKYETSINHSDGSERNVIIEEAPLTDLNGIAIGFVGVINDITEIRVAEKERVRVSKLESLGVLAGGIAHDFNNILTTILGNIALAKIYGDVNTDKLQRLLENAEQAAIRAKDLTRELLIFSKGGSPVKKVMSIRDLLENTVAFSLAGTAANYELDMASDLFSVEIDENQISQVIGNIVLNAEQAMPHGGTVRVAAENVTLDSVNGPLNAGDYITISIKDQGIGISEKHLDMIFDPYFTTKEKGSGLGLAICHFIIQKHQGHIGVESTLGVGTTFVVYLPAAEVKHKAEEQKDKTVMMSGHGKILVMDDEETIRSMVGDILQYLGYTVDFAKDGEEALSMYASRPYDAVILDLTIPGGMGGKETIEHLRAIDPAIKAIVSSGYCNDPIMSDYRQYGFKGVIVKPYTIHEISSVLRDVMS
ncbi:MAG TPA: ATP-binding protein [Syntrophorhabdaceae bacterium]|nr:ATP-binding protein [Syntrophorhabdaceae bacterium]HQM82333.1 ATP-binding protein [Syntrophorhabdaceae bacterium]